MLPNDPQQPTRSVGPSAESTAQANGQRKGDGAHPDWIGPYKILQLLGEGGFGSVWMAEQREPVRRRVALKIIKLGMDTKQVIARFEAERQALAMMDHPNIAKVLDAGATDIGRPYFVMEYIRGVPILEYCDTEKLNTQARLELFVQVCHAIQHAHQKGIIHRDIKPSNVLVTLHDGKPVPKVIDFGIAKATNTDLTQKTLFTEHRQMIGTPAYMSPEQAEMSGLDVDTRSDIYSLGVLLYELLTGTTPFDSTELLSKGYAEMMRIIREVEPHKPSTRLSTLGETASQIARQRHADVGKLGMLLRGDLDWIVMKCIEKDRTRRYDTANGLAMDVQRHLRGEPVIAAPPSRGYKLRKFVGRNRSQVIAGCIVAAVLVVGAVGTSAGMVWALREKGRANESARLTALAAQAETEARRQAEANERRAVEEADRAERETERARAAEADAKQRADELEKLAEFQSSQLTNIETELMGIRIRRRVIDKRREALESRGMDGPEIESSLHTLEQSLGGVNFTNIALETLDESIFQRVVASIERDLADQPLVRARLLQTLANTLRELGLFDRAAELQMTAVAIRREALGDKHPHTLASLNDMGRLFRERGKYAEAETYIREALDGRRRVLGDEHPETLNSIYEMGELLLEQGRYVEAEAYTRKALEGCRRVLGNEHRDTLGSINNMGVLLSNQGKRAEAESYYREALEGNRRIFGNEHRDTLNSINNMGALLSEQGRFAEAESYYHEALKGYRRVLGDEHPATLNSINNMGALLSEQGRFAEAESYYREALEGYRRVLGDEHPATLNSINNMGVLLRDQGKDAEAESYYREALESRRRVLGDEHPNTFVSIQAMGWRLWQRGRLAEAESYYHEALEGRRRILGDEHPDTLSSINAMGGLLRLQGKLAEAESYYRESLEGCRRVLGDEHPDTLVTGSNFALLLADLGRGEEALALVDKAIERERVLSGETRWQYGNFLGKRGRALEALGRLDEAEQVMLEAHGILVATVGDTHDQTTRVTGYIGNLYEHRHETEPDKGYGAKAAEWRAKLKETSKNTGEAGE